MWGMEQGQGGDNGRQLSSKKSHCCSLLRREVERESGEVMEGRREVARPFFSHSRILTPPCGDWVPWESPLGGAGPNSNRFTKLSY